MPDVAAFGMNVTLLAAGPARGGAFVERLSFPLFAAGERRAQAPWAGAGPLPAGLQLDYVPSQLMLLCVAQARLYPARLPCITQGACAALASEPRARQGGRGSVWNATLQDAQCRSR